MCRKLIFSTSIVFVLGMVSSASAYDVGVVLKCDAGTGDLQTGWIEVVDGWNPDVNSTGIWVKLETGDPDQIEERDEGGDGPLADVETDFYFADDRNTSPENDFILTLSGLANGAHRLRSYHNRSNEPPVPIPLVTVTGAASVISVPSQWYWQEHLTMTIPLEVLFTVTGGQVAIRYKGPDFGAGGTGQVYFNGFVLEYFGTQNEAPYDPDPADEAEQLCPDDVTSLSWTAGASATSHDIYFGTDINDVDPQQSPTPVELGWLSSSWTPPSLDLGTTYYWRVDEDTGSTTWEGAIWRFATNDGNAVEPYPGDGWRGVPTDVNLSWLPGCDTDSHNVYLGTDEPNVAAGTSGTFQGNQTETSYDPGGLVANTTYYWRIEEVRAGPNSPGEVWSFKTSSGVAGAIMYYKFDGSLGADLPSSVVDSTGNETFYKFIADGNDVNDYVIYGQSNPAVNASSGTSAEFSPEAGLYRNGKGPGDLLALDGFQYTVELWMNAYEIPGSLDDDPRGEGDKLIARGGAFWTLEVRRRNGVIFLHTGSEGDRQNKFIYTGKNTIRENEWYHVAAVFDMTDADAAMKLYLDGQLMASAARPQANPPDNNEPTAIGFQRAGAGGEDYLKGLVDEVRISNVALTVDEFLLVPGPEWARSPYPANNERRIDPNVVLSWVPGIAAASHDVYLGANYDDVVNATTSDPQFLDNVGPNSIDPLGATPLDFGTRYYWRVDELNGGGPWNGVVWSFTVRSEIDDPNMILWYKFDETSGNEAFDASGHDYFGVVDGDEDGWDPSDGEGGCRLFDDDTAVEVPPEMLGNMVREISIAVWLKDAVRLGEDNWLFDCQGGGPVAMSIAVVDENGDAYWRAGTDGEDVLVWNMIRSGINPSTLQDWHNWVFIKSEITPEISIYFDGELADSNAVVDSSLSFLRNAPCRIGAWGGHSNDFVGKVDDFMVFDYALSPADVRSLFRRGDLALAWGPDPGNGETDISRDVDLIWRPGDYAASHDVYFGTDFNDVNNANTSSYTFRENREPNQYDPGELTLQTTYYWRIDEVNDANANSPWKGKTWQFTVANYLVIDDMETYNTTDNRIYHTWDDGFINNTGSEVTLGTDPVDPVHSGGVQSMEYLYDNADSKTWGLDYYSEISVDALHANLKIGSRDWTDAGVKILTMFFYGDPGNDANEQMYVGLTDTSGPGSYAQVDYGFYGEDNNDIREAEWHQWDIGLPDFTDVDESAVGELYIGFGIRGNPNPGGTPGGNGTVFFDNIRLYPPKCIPWRVKPRADFTNDCRVDLADVGEMAEEWLKSDACLPTQQPAVGPVAYWDYEEGDGNTVNDSINNYDGTAEGDYEWVAGRIGSYAMEFDGGWVAVPDGGNTPLLRVEGDRMSVTAWTKVTDHIDDYAFLVIRGRDDYETYGLEINEEDKGFTFFVRDANADIYDLDSENSLPEDEWLHIAGTYDGNNLTSYVNGRVEMTDAIGSIDLYVDANDGLGMGGRWDDSGGRFLGTMDEVQVYSYALSAEEVAYIATEGGGYVPLLSEVNLYDEEEPGEKAVNFRDLDVLLDEWLDEWLWPQ